MVPPTLVRTAYSNDRTFEEFTPRVSLSYKATDDINLYASYGRGFKSGGIGPRDTGTSNNDAVGAEAYAFGTAEVSFPNGLPEALGITTSLFSDFGYIGMADEPAVPTIQDKFAPRVSAGLSVNWKSPFGPVRLDFAKVLVDEPYDQRELFRFSAGTQF